MGCYDATKGTPEGDLNPAQLEAFENIDTLFKGALLSVLDDCRGFVTADVLKKGLSRGAIATG